MAWLLWNRKHCRLPITRGCGIPLREYAATTNYDRVSLPQFASGCGTIRILRIHVPNLHISLVYNKPPAGYQSHLYNKTDAGVLMTPTDHLVLGLRPEAASPSTCFPGFLHFLPLQPRISQNLKDADSGFNFPP